MNDLVSKKCILDAVKPMFRLVGNGDNPLSIVYNRGLNDVLDAIRRMPEVDAVEVVRCKDCKYRRHYVACPLCRRVWTRDDDDGLDYYIRDETVDDGFCNYGAKMMGGENK